MTGPMFLSLDSEGMATCIGSAQVSVCYAAPGIQLEPAEALARLAKHLGPELITVILDFDERVMRMGFGDLAAVAVLRGAGITVRSTPGLRTGLLDVWSRNLMVRICGESAWLYGPCFADSFVRGEAPEGL